MHGIKSKLLKAIAPEERRQNEMNGARSAASRKSYAVEPTSADIHRPAPRPPSRIAAPASSSQGSGLLHSNVVNCPLCDQDMVWSLPCSIETSN
jgi:hypothetical protein